MQYQPVPIIGFQAGLTKNKKPMFLINSAFQKLENAYSFRETVKKREGIKLVGRLRRCFTTAVTLSTQAIGASYLNADILADPSFNLRATEPDAQIEPGSVVITVGNLTFIDANANGILVQTGTITGITNANPAEVTSNNHTLTTGTIIIISGVTGMTEINNTSVIPNYTITVTGVNTFTLNGIDSLAFGVYAGGGTWVATEATSPNVGTINYVTGELNLTFDPALGVATNVDIEMCYFPDLPAMGIDSRELGGINDEQTAFFDTKYVYVYDDNDFDSPTTTTWSGTNAEFFWMANYRGIEPQTRVFYVTNFATPSLSVNNRIRYTTNMATWNVLQAQVDPTNYIFQAKLIIPYYGRLLLLNTWEGPNPGASVNLYNRCRFSQIGNPLESTVAPPIVDTAWRSDQFGRGGFIDAPTNEAITSCRFYKNTLIVFFERSTWQIRYVGEYGLPFIWERISSDFGSESTFSTVLFDKGVLAVGDKAIIASSGNDAERIDLDIPDAVFNFQNIQNGKERVHGTRDFQKELVYWSFVEPDSDGNQRIFPNKVLLYNYRNNTWATLRDNVTCFGLLQNASGDSWDLPTSWDSDTSWDTFYQSEFPMVISGNQQGFIHYYQYPLDPDTIQDNEVELREHESLFVKDIIRSNTDPLRFEIPNHNLSQGETIFLAGALFADTVTSTPIATSLNNRFYFVQNVEDENNIDVFQWDPALQDYVTTSFNQIGFTPAPGTGTYMGGGVVAILPKIDIITKDFNPYQEQGKRVKTGYLDFNTDAAPGALVSVNLYVDSSIGDAANLPVYNTSMETSLSQQGEITGATQTNPCVITSANHSLQTGRELTIANVNGMTQLNGGLYTITVLTLNTFSLDGVDATIFTAYSYGGNWITQDQTPFYISGSQYAWHRFYSNVYGQYINAQVTYNDDLMNSPVTHTSDFQMNGLILWAKPAGGLAQ